MSISGSGVFYGTPYQQTSEDTFERVNYTVKQKSV